MVIVQDGIHAVSTFEQGEARELSGHCDLLNCIQFLVETVAIPSWRGLGEGRQQPKQLVLSTKITCAAGGSRTPNPQLRRLVLYPVELRPQEKSCTKVTKSRLSFKELSNTGTQISIAFLANFYLLPGVCLFTLEIGRFGLCLLTSLDSLGRLRHAKHTLVADLNAAYMISVDC